MSYGFRNTLRDAYPSAPELTEKDYPDLTGKTFLVTGTSAGVGQQAARLLLSKNATVVTVNRNLAKTEAATKVIIDDLISADTTLTDDKIRSRLIQIQADLADLTTIKPAVSNISNAVSQLDTVILNAGVMQPPLGSLTKQGYELQFGANVMGHQLLLDLITPLVQKSAKSGNTPRVIFTTSLSHSLSPPNGGLTWDFTNPTIVQGQTLYGQSKTGNIYQAAMYAEQYKNVISLAVHPGFLNSDLQRDMPLPSFVLNFMKKAIFYPPVYGAYTELWAALNPKITQQDSGRYVAPWGQFRDLRDDVEKGKTNGTAKKMLDWVEKEIEQYK
ncbi:CYFA0S01e01816g1_1 [Cyberlindnera fabianii]|uniref:CYFA0S01e01816g1_1 n=1 Tax=Cyberlindnera fabianii TaxID=36022 RepID=A0A061AG35_CYBFA|nr:CYFA0S01e01816g1_1 [Cyberlindnera fabianii]